MHHEIMALIAHIETHEKAIRRDAMGIVAQLSVENPSDWQTTITHAIKAGLSQKNLAEIGATSTSSISRWADGSSVPPVTSRRWIQRELCRMLDVPCEASTLPDAAE